MQALDVSNKLSLSSIQSRYLSRLSADFTDLHEFIDAGIIQYAYSILRPTDADFGKLDLFIAYLCKSNAVCFAFTLVTFHTVFYTSPFVSRF